MHILISTKECIYWLDSYEFQLHIEKLLKNPDYWREVLGPDPSPESGHLMRWWTLVALALKSRTTYWRKRGRRAAPKYSSLKK